MAMEIQICLSSEKVIKAVFTCYWNLKQSRTTDMDSDKGEVILMGTRPILFFPPGAIEGELLTVFLYPFMSLMSLQK